MNEYDGTNIFLSIIGDEPNLRDVSMTNNASITVVEPLTNTKIPPGQTVLVRVKGDVAYDTILSNIEQINTLDGFEVIGVASVPVVTEVWFPIQFPAGYGFANATYENKVFTKTPESIVTHGEDTYFVAMGCDPISVGQKYRVHLAGIANLEKLEIKLSRETNIASSQWLSTTDVKLVYDPIADTLVTFVDGSETTSQATSNDLILEIEFERVQETHSIFNIKQLNAAEEVVADQSLWVEFDGNTPCFWPIVFAENNSLPVAVPMECLFIAAE